MSQPSFPTQPARVNPLQLAVLLVDGARKLADGDQLIWKQTVLVRGE
jgi:hypothetical protein